MPSVFQILTQSFLTVVITEMGDKTQLLAFVLASRFRKPLPILAGILIATILNHSLAATVGVWVSQALAPQTLKWILAAVFVAFAGWVLIPDKEDEDELSNKYGPFLTTLVVFFLAEMGDKTQLSTVALAAQYKDLFWVTFGTTLGMMVSDGLAIVFGDRLTRVVPMKWVHRFAALMFLVYALYILVSP